MTGTGVVNLLVEYNIYINHYFVFSETLDTNSNYTNHINKLKNLVIKNSKMLVFILKRCW